MEAVFRPTALMDALLFGDAARIQFRPAVPRCWGSFLTPTYGPTALVSDEPGAVVMGRNPCVRLRCANRTYAGYAG